MGSIPVTRRQPAEEPAKQPTATPPLEEGDHLDQRTFHDRYEAMPEDVRAELIGGIVFMPSTLKRPHRRVHVRVIHWLSEYEDATPGTEVFDNATTILGPKDEPQPDAGLLITAPGHEQSREEDEYTVGAPEWLGEIASSTAAIDLHRKRTAYERAGVKEYVIFVVREQRVLWLANRAGSFAELAPGPDGILRSEVFPGLWLDPEALLRGDKRRALEVLQQGLATPEHAAFVARLAGTAGA
jgi:Uma2 family endonuclease